jgi:hypothetical protein
MPMDCCEFVHIPINLIPDKILHEYQLHNLVDSKGFVLARIRKRNVWTTASRHACQQTTAGAIGTPWLPCLQAHARTVATLQSTNHVHTHCGRLWHPLRRQTTCPSSHCSTKAGLQGSNHRLGWHVILWHHTQLGLSSKVSVNAWLCSQGPARVPIEPTKAEHKPHCNNELQYRVNFSSQTLSTLQHH